MDVVHLEIDDPRWPDALRRLRHDFYHLPAYVRLDGAHPMAFLARSGDEELFVPYLLRCESLWPESMGGREVYDVVSAYGYPGLLLSDAARRSPRFARDAGGSIEGDASRAGGLLRVPPHAFPPQRRPVGALFRGFLHRGGRDGRDRLDPGRGRAVERDPGRPPVDDQEVQEAGLRAPHGAAGRTTSSA